MFNPTFALVRGASRMQARSLLRASTRNAHDLIASTARDRHEKRSNESQQSNKSSGRRQRHNSRLPLRLTAVAGFSVLALANCDDQKSPQPNYAFKDPSGWGHMNTNYPAFYEFAMRFNRAKDTNSIEEARSAHFDLTRTLLESCIHGELIDEGPLSSDIVFGPGRYVKKEDTKVFWMASPEQGRSSILCLSVHCDLVNDGEENMVFVHDALGAGMYARVLEKFKEESGPHIFVHIHYPLGFFSVASRRDDLVIMLERGESLSAIEE